MGLPSQIAQAFANACDGSPSGVSIADLDEVVVKLVQQAIDGDAKPEDILNEGLVAGMDIVGRKFKEQLVFVPEVLFAARAMKGGVELLKPLLAETGIEPTGTMIIGTIKGDLHDIGKHLVAMMVEGAGFEVIDLGVDVTPEKFVETAKENSGAIVAMSALLTTTMPGMRRTVELLREAGLDNPAMIGGAPVTQSFSDEIGAQGYAPDAASAVDKAKELAG